MSRIAGFENELPGSDERVGGESGHTAAGNEGAGGDTVSRAMLASEVRGGFRGLKVGARSVCVLY